MADNSDIEITVQENITVVNFKATSISNPDNISSARLLIKDFVEKNSSENIIFDFEQVKFFSSQVLGVLLDIRSQLQQKGGNVVISAIDPQLHRVFRITNLDKIFNFFPDKLSAIESLSSDK